MSLNLNQSQEPTIERQLEKFFHCARTTDVQDESPYSLAQILGPWGPLSNWEATLMDPMIRGARRPLRDVFYLIPNYG